MVFFLPSVYSDQTKVDWKFLEQHPDIQNIRELSEVTARISPNARGLPQFGYLMLCPPDDDGLKKRKFDENEKPIAKRSRP